jgi:hypothetical protein
MSTPLVAKLAGLRERLSKGDISPNEAVRLLESCEAELSGLGTTPASIVQSLFPLVVDYDLSIEELVRRGGYDWSDGDINGKKFLIDRHGQECVNAELVHLNEAVSTKDALRGLANRNLHTANIVETLTFGLTYKDKQRKYPIVGLGSSCTVLGDRYFPCLWSIGSERRLDLHWTDSGWHSDCRFLAIRK